MKRTTIIFNIALGLFCGALLTGCGSPDDDPSAGAGGNSEGVRPEGMENAPVTSKDGKSTVGTDEASKVEDVSPSAKGKKP